MPTYAFRCDHCGNRFEAEGKMRQPPPPPDCPRCGKQTRRDYTRRPPATHTETGRKP